MEENSSNWNSVSLLIFKITLFLALSAHLTSSIHMPEFFEHLARGHWIAANKSLPDHYLWASPGIHEWKDPNWLFEVLLSLTETHLGEKGLIVVKMSLIFLALSSMSLLFSSLAKNKFFGTLLSLIVASGFFVDGDLSPSYFALPLLCLFFYFIQKDKLNLLLLFFISYALVNVSAALSLVLLLSLFIIKSRKEFLTITILLLFAFLSPPYWGTHLLHGLNYELSTLSWDILLQRSAANIYDFRFAFLLLIWVLIALFSDKQKLLSIRMIFLFSALSVVISLASNHYLAFALVFSACIAARLWDDNNNLAKGLGLLSKKLSKVSPLGIIWVLFAICIITVRPRIYYPVSYALLPKLEVDTAIARGLKLPIYHDSFVGSYLSYRFSMANIKPGDTVLSTPQSEAFPSLISSIDARSAQIGHLARNLNPIFLVYFDFLSPKSVICRQSDPIYSVLIRDPRWKAIETSREGNSLFSWVLFERSE